MVGRIEILESMHFVFVLKRKEGLKNVADRKACIAAAGAILAIIALYMELPVWMVMIVLFIRSVGTAFHSTALSAVTPLLVPEEQLTKCAGYSQSLQSISYILSPAAAAFLYSVWELNAIIAIDVLGAVIACITVALVRIPKLSIN